jgi:hypothetical protein
MAIPESQLKKWSHQGSIIQSSETYNAIKNALQANYAPYADKNYCVFLQGSYGNDTNIWTESDVDIVIKLNECLIGDLNDLSQNERDQYDALDNAKYTYINFKEDVIDVLVNKYGKDVIVGNKAISINSSGNRRKADIIVAIQFRRYYKFTSVLEQSYVEGLCFFTDKGTKIVNYPRLHLKNCITKHKATNGCFKPMVRILKNLRGKLVDEKFITYNTAPSYFIEGLLYNVPNEKYIDCYEDSFVNCINWILEANRSNFVCANEQYYLIRDIPNITWTSADFDKFLDAIIELWNQW